MSRHRDTTILVNMRIPASTLNKLDDLREYNRRTRTSLVLEWMHKWISDEVAKRSIQDAAISAYQARIKSAVPNDPHRDTSGNRIRNQDRWESVPDAFYSSSSIDEE